MLSINLYYYQDLFHSGVILILIVGTLSTNAVGLFLGGVLRYLVYQECSRVCVYVYPLCDHWSFLLVWL